MSDGRQSFETGQAGDAVGALGIEGVSRRVVLGAEIVGVVVVGMAAMAIFNGNGGQFGHGCHGGVGGAAAGL